MTSSKGSLRAWLLVAAVAGISTAAAAGGCANDEGDGVLTSGTGAAGGAGGAAGGGGGTGGASLCDVDCASIETPPCLTSVCNDGQYPGEVGACVVVDGPAGEPCDDGLYCTTNDVCSAGECVGGPPNDCDLDPPPCTEVTCVEESRSCTTAPSEEFAPCIPENLCEVNGTCQGGECNGSPKSCMFSPLAECNVVACDQDTGACAPSAPTNEGAACILTGDPCMVGKSCAAGSCAGGTPKDCSGESDSCNEGACNPGNGNCFPDPLPPGGACTEGVGQCQVGSCDVNGACDPMPANEGTACNDGVSCTSTDVCTGGTCEGAPNAGFDLFFSETFANGGGAWTLGTEWQIGPAVAGPPGACGDPGTDTTPSGDNYLAGVAIGGCSPSSVANAVHGMYYLTSPVIDTSGAPGAVSLQFWRWLRSDYTPYMNNVVEVYNGSTWVQLWQSGGTGISDSAWVFITHDLTAHKNANMQVRFGFDIGSSGVFDEGSWNIDDVVVANQVCP